MNQTTTSEKGIPMKTTRITIVAATLAVWTGATQASDIRAASWYPQDHSISSTLYGYYAEKASEYSDGELNVQADLGSVLITPKDALKSVSTGLVDVTVHMGQYTPSELNISAALEEVAVNYVDVPNAAMIAAIIDFSVNDEQMLAQWNQSGVVYGGPYITEPYKLTCTSPVTSLEDMRGKRVRMPSRSMSAFAEEVGMIPVSMSGNEQYSALDKGVLDCTTATFGDIHQRRLYEVTSDAVDMPLTIFWAGFAWGYNPDTWADLTADERRALLKAQADALAEYFIPGPKTREEVAYEELPGLGVEIHEPDPNLVAALSDFSNKTAEEAPELAEAAYRVENAAELYDRFDETVTKWRNRVAELGLTELSLDNKDIFHTMLDEEVFGPIDVTTYGLD
ncbi:TRAP transporter substrate-binding protein DctP [Vreelandella populi]|uniref:C4-dicarboxylate ABC transporter substrate-binding protein n=1 Tax=Vreelandella populi TaxID=2498858 RepID=A0A3S0WHU8_9GAMM|nr:TRAP transporter substrate-binding protein DctP [Halomonas populi]RUR43599.1 hypothetical protein ELY37_18100 [Halomonas populi]